MAVFNVCYAQQVIVYSSGKKGKFMFEKKTVEIKSPDLKKMQEIIIDLRTRIYVPIEEDPQKARERYMTKFQTMKKF
jgi:hypothetical protein